MRVKISKELKQLYDTSKKEPEYSLQFIADSMDPDCCAAAAVLVQNMLLEALLWVAILFPEV